MMEAVFVQLFKWMMLWYLTLGRFFFFFFEFFSQVSLGCIGS